MPLSQSLKNYILFHSQENKKKFVPKTLSEKLIYSLYFPESFKKSWENEVKTQAEKGFYYLSAALQAIASGDKKTSFLFFFQSFFLFFKEAKGLDFEDRLIILNEWYYQFSSYMDIYSDSNSEINDYSVSLLLSSANLLYFTPSYYFINPHILPDFSTFYFKKAGDILLERADLNLSDQDELFYMGLLKIYLVNSLILISEKNYLKASLFLDKNLAFFDKKPIEEDFFIIYKETLKNKIYTSLWLNQNEASAVFLKKYLDYSLSAENLPDNWEELKEYLYPESKAKSFFAREDIQKLLRKYRLI